MQICSDFLRKVANRQPDKQTDKQRFHNLLGRGNQKSQSFHQSRCCALSITHAKHGGIGCLESLSAKFRLKMWMALFMKFQDEVCLGIRNKQVDLVVIPKIWIYNPFDVCCMTRAVTTKDIPATVVIFRSAHKAVKNCEIFNWGQRTSEILGFCRILHWTRPIQLSRLSWFLKCISGSSQDAQFSENKTSIFMKLLTKPCSDHYNKLVNVFDFELRLYIPLDTK